MMAQELEIVRIPVQTGNAQSLLDALQSARAGYLSSPACQNLALLLNEAADEVVAIVTWSSAEAHNEAAQRPDAASFFKLVTSFANGRPEVRRYRPIGETSS
jgi:quinol monooxygenase YgiN